MLQASNLVFYHSRRFPIVSFWQKWSDFHNLYEHKIHFNQLSWSLKLLFILFYHLTLLLTWTSGRDVRLTYRWILWPLHSSWSIYRKFLWCLLWGSYSVYSVFPFFISSESLGFCLIFFPQYLCQLFKFSGICQYIFFKRLPPFPNEFSIRRSCSVFSYYW